MTDLETWLLDTGQERIFRLWKYKRMFTPYEQEKQFCDESQYESSQASFIIIKEVIELPDKDVLIGYQELFQYSDLEIDNPYIYYVKLSEIVLNYNPEDMKEENWE